MTRRKTDKPDHSAVALPEDSRVHASGHDQALVLPLIVGFALFMGTLDATIIANALPTMAVSLHRSPLSLNVAITSYLLASAIFLPLSSWLADRYGTRIVFRSAILIFAAASFGCGQAQTLWLLLLARVVQGMASAMMLPVGRLALLRVLPKHEFVRAMGYLILPGVLGTVLGPPLGGFLVSFSNWRWIFYINVPMGLIGAILVHRFMPNIREKNHVPLDWIGLALTGSGLACVVYGLERIGLSPAVCGGLIVLGILLGVTFHFYAQNKADAILDLGVLKDRNFRIGTVGGLLLRLPLGATPFLMALLLQIGFGYSAFHAGLISLADALGNLLTMHSTAYLVGRFGYKKVLITDVALSATLQACYGLLHLQTPVWRIALLLFAAGMCRSVMFTSLNAVAFTDLPYSAMSRASSLASVATQIASSLGVGVSSLILQILMARHRAGTITPREVLPIFFLLAVPTLLSLFFMIGLPNRASTLRREAAVAEVLVGE